MNNDHQERSGLLAGDYDDPDLDNVRASPEPPDENQALPGQTPFPYKTVALLVFSNAMVVTSFHVIYPFINQMIVELGIAKNSDSAGYYSGLFESGLALSGFVTTIPCSYASDTFGRRPVIIASMIGTMLSMFCFGISRTFPGLLVSRCIGGGFGPNWTWSASFTVLGEITDASTAGGAYSAMNMGFSVGMMISPSIGGFLAHPSEHFSAFQGDFWKKYPFALPCFTGVVISAITVLVIVLFLPETLPSKRDWARKRTRQLSVSMHASMYSTSSAAGPEGFVNNNPVGILSSVSRRHSREMTDDSEYQAASESLLPSKGKVSVMSVLTRTTIPVLISSFALSFLAVAWFAIYPLWAFTPIDKGGLGAPESSIGLQLTIRGLLHVLTMAIYAPLERRLGLHRLYAWSMAMWILSGLCYPLLSFWARVNGSSEGFLFQVLLILWFTIWSFAGFVWTGNPQMVNLVAPSEEALARIIGVSNVCTLLGGTIGPVLATSLFQWSISLDFAGGNLIWILMFVVSSISTIHAFTLRLPDRGRHTLPEESVVLHSVESLSDNRRDWAE